MSFYICLYFVSFFLFYESATTRIYTYGPTLSLHDALPICPTAYWTGGCGLIGRAISEAFVGAGARSIVLDTGQALADAPKLGSDAVAFDAADLDDMVR